MATRAQAELAVQGLANSQVTKKLMAMIASTHTSSLACDPDASADGAGHYAGFVLLGGSASSAESGCSTAMKNAIYNYILAAYSNITYNAMTPKPWPGSFGSLPSINTGSGGQLNGLSDVILGYAPGAYWSGCPDPLADPPINPLAKFQADIDQYLIPSEVKAVDAAAIQAVADGIQHANLRVALGFMFKEQPSFETDLDKKQALDKIYLEKGVEAFRSAVGCTDIPSYADLSS